MSYTRLAYTQMMTPLVEVQHPCGGKQLYTDEAMKQRISRLGGMNKKLCLVLLLIGVASGNLQWNSLPQAHFEAVPKNIPIIALSFVYQNVVPVLCTNLEGNLSKVRTSIVLGTAIPLILFLVWDAVILRTISSLHTNSGRVIDPLELLRSNNGIVGPIVELFSFLAIGTSYIGFVLGLSDFVSDCQTQKKRGRGYDKPKWGKSGKESIAFTEDGLCVDPKDAQLSRYLGSLAKNSRFLPLKPIDWRLHDDTTMDHVWKTIYDTIDWRPEDVPNIPKIRLVMLQRLSDRCRNYKGSLKAKYYTPYVGLPERFLFGDDRVDRDQWQAMVNYWDTDPKNKVRCEKNIESRKRQKMNHTGGTKSFARHMADYEKMIDGLKTFNSKKLAEISKLKEDVSHLEHKLHEWNNRIRYLSEEVATEKQERNDTGTTLIASFGQPELMGRAEGGAGGSHEDQG
ncbi:uncharacterized protein A4U43_C03F19540 [Asparagus officinalis]|uniref:Uncharacterized protein n=1 Tax=Asparagus officinalis TaxID=4686 RepID=A0A5P1FC74_ASPOF|nr:uncharacterized protein A4U43_C03F19540 [Asparagus officinalis]